MNLTRITFTGADDSIDPNDLDVLTKRFPFVDIEWGILFSRSQQGGKRFPSLEWVRRLPPALNYSAHLCGAYARDLCEAGQFSWMDCDVPHENFDRIQLNFHASKHTFGRDFESIVHESRNMWQIIFQCDGVNDGGVGEFCAMHDRCIPLFDTSGGAGIVPKTWPRSWLGKYCGYAGGLGPDNVVSELGRIEPMTNGEPFFIDMERNVRSADDSQFDLNKCEQVLERVAPLISVRR